MDVALNSCGVLSAMSSGKAEPFPSKMRLSCLVPVIEIMSSADALPLETVRIVSKVSRNDGY